MKDAGVPLRAKKISGDEHRVLYSLKENFSDTYVKIGILATITSLPILSYVVFSIYRWGINR